MTSADVEARHHDHAVVVGHDHVARVHHLLAARDGQVHVAQRLLDRAVRRDRARPDRKAHLLQIVDVAAAGVDDQPAHAARLQRGAQQLAEIARSDSEIGAATRMSPSPALLDRDVDHPVVARRAERCDGGAADRRAAPDRPHARAPCRPVRPCASWTVATPYPARASAAAPVGAGDVGDDDRHVSPSSCQSGGAGREARAQRPSCRGCAR